MEACVATETESAEAGLHQGGAQERATKVEKARSLARTRKRPRGGGHLQHHQALLPKRKTRKTRRARTTRRTRRTTRRRRPECTKDERTTTRARSNPQEKQEKSGVLDNLQGATAEPPQHEDAEEDTKYGLQARGTLAQCWERHPLRRNGSKRHGA